MTVRKPLALSNWKMAMTAAESLAFVHDLRKRAAGLLEQVDVVICPPFTALQPVARVLRDSPIQLGGQNIAESADPARTGEISATLLADIGCSWVMLGHWEIRRHLGDDDRAVNQKVHLALKAGLAPIVLIGEAVDDQSPLETALARQLSSVLEGCRAADVAAMAFVYEPESAIGAGSAASRDQVAAGCRVIRDWLRGRWGDGLAERVRIIYGGSVAPELAAGLLSSADVDGLGATRRGRDPVTFSAIIRQIVQAKLGASGSGER